MIVFGRLLRRVGLDIAVDQMVDAVDAVARVGVARRDDVYFALRGVCVRRADERPLFEAAFNAFWQDLGERWGRRDLRALGEAREAVTIEIETVIAQTADESADDTDDADDSSDALPSSEIKTSSRVEAIRDLDFAALSDQELAEARVRAKKAVDDYCS